MTFTTSTSAAISHPASLAALALEPGLAPAANRQRAPGDKRRVSSEDLLAGSTEIEIDHGESVYRLRLTSLGKLILTK